MIKESHDPTLCLVSTYHVTYLVVMGVAAGEMLLLLFIGHVISHNQMIKGSCDLCSSLLS